MKTVPDMDNMTIADTVLHSMKRMKADKVTLRKLQSLSAPELPVLTKEEIKAIREKTNTSQPVFAIKLSVSPKCVQKWESGESKPKGAANLLLHLVARKGLHAIAL